MTCQAETVLFLTEEHGGTEAVHTPTSMGGMVKVTAVVLGGIISMLMREIGTHHFAIQIWCWDGVTKDLQQCYWNNYTYLMHHLETPIYDHYMELRVIWSHEVIAKVHKY